MKNYVHLSYGDASYGRHLVEHATSEPGADTWSINLAHIPGFPNLDARRRRRRRPSEGPIQRFLDPQREHPFLKSLMQAVGPILQGFISTQLPTLLNSLTQSVDPDEIND